MKTIIGWPLAWLLYIVGDIVSKPMYRYDVCAKLYPLYNKLMCWSSSVQDWCGCSGPWKNVEE